MNGPVRQWSVGIGLSVGLLLIGLTLWVNPAQSAATFAAPGFSETQVVGGLAKPTSMTFAPDGRIFVTQQEGALKVVKKNASGDYATLPTPFTQVETDSVGERGLLGVALDPKFKENGYVYAYYTVPASDGKAPFNRVVRFTADPDNPNVAKPDSRKVLLDLNPLGATNHNGGALHFRNGKLFIAVGDNSKQADPSINSQSLTTLHGKMLRINKDGSIPKSNPFYDEAKRKNRAIWALGLRNPFSFDVQPRTGKMYINDVGQKTWEEIDEGKPGANFGWPLYEGPESDPKYDGPVFAYRHDAPALEGGCAITGGAFYNPATADFPQSYVGDYFFADFCRGLIWNYDSTTKTTANFAKGLLNPVDIDVAKGGDLFYLSRGGGTIQKVGYTGP